MSKCIECGFECEETPGYDVALLCEDCFLMLEDEQDDEPEVPDHECESCETCGDCHICRPL